ncbi:MAG: preprotein translocase subunit SecY [Spirochaetes bacterium]|nr:preprotein translocase subunit SecY [Spirochaetota bacterium]
MADIIRNIFKVKELRNKLMFTFFILVIYRIGAHIPIPGINITALNKFFENLSQGAAGGFLNFFDLFAGGALKRFTVFALGIMPYISASIIFQLLVSVVPSLEKIQKEGPEGQKKIKNYTNYLAIVICLFQSIGVISVVVNANSDSLVIVPNTGVLFYVTAIMSVTTGTMVLVWLGNVITERGIGNGISLIIFCGIVVRFPASIIDTGRRIVNRSEPILGILLVFLFFGVIAAAILLTLGRRNIPIQYGKRQIGGRSVATNQQFLPIPLNVGNVIPIIFAVAIMQFPQILLSYIKVDQSNSFMVKLQTWLSPGQIPYMISYALLIIMFCYFYATIAFNPEKVSDNLKKYQGFIPGIRPGTATTEYLFGLLNRLTLSGSLFLALIAVTPDLIIKLWPEAVSREMAYMFGGTTLLIAVGVALDTLKQIESQLMMRHYDGFFKNTKLKSRKF